MDRKRVIVGITGATGTIYGVRLLQLLRTAGIETHLVVSSAGEISRAYETNLSKEELRALADVAYPNSDTPFASGEAGVSNSRTGAFCFRDADKFPHPTPMVRPGPRRDMFGATTASAFTNFAPAALDCFNAKEPLFTLSTIRLASVRGAGFVYRETSAADRSRWRLPVEQNRNEHTNRSDLGRRL